jgi:hypothetical protein
VGPPFAPEHQAKKNQPMSISKTGTIALCLATLCAHVHAELNPCQLVSAAQQQELSLSEANHAVIPADIDGKQFGLDRELTGSACEFIKTKYREKMKLLSVFKITDEQDRIKLKKHFGADLKQGAKPVSPELAGNMMRVKDGLCEAIHFGPMQLSICIGLVSDQLMLVSTAEANTVGKAWPPLKAVKLFNEAAGVLEARP